MKDIKNYKEYEALFDDDLVVAVRNLLMKIEDEGSRNVEDSKEHNALISYFNKFALHSKIDKGRFETW